MALLAAFVAGILWSLVTHRAVVCACFGVGGQQLGVTHVVRNGLLIIIAVVGATVGLLSAGGPVIATAAGVATAVGLLLATLFIRWEDLSYVFTPR